MEETVRYTLTYIEYARAMRFAAIARIQLWLFVAAGLIAIALAILLRSGALGGAGAGLLAYPLAGLMIGPNGSWQRGETLLAREQMISLTPDGLVHESCLTRDKLSWSLVEGIRRFGGVYLVYIEGRRFYPVPLRAFASPDDARRFREFVGRELARRDVAPAAA